MWSPVLLLGAAVVGYAVWRTGQTFARLRKRDRELDAAHGSAQSA